MRACVDSDIRQRLLADLAAQVAVNPDPTLVAAHRANALRWIGTFSGAEALKAWRTRYMGGGEDPLQLKTADLSGTLLEALIEIRAAAASADWRDGRPRRLKIIGRLDRVATGRAIVTVRAWSALLKAENRLLSAVKAGHAIPGALLDRFHRLADQVDEGAGSHGSEVGALKVQIRLLKFNVALFKLDGLLFQSVDFLQRHQLLILQRLHLLQQIAGGLERRLQLFRLLALEEAWQADDEIDQPVPRPQREVGGFEIGGVHSRVSGTSDCKGHQPTTTAESRP